MARNKRNLTWLLAHFLNGMFPLLLTDIMYLLWITTGKIALVSISFSFPFSLSFFYFSLSPFFRLSTFRTENALVRRRWILVRSSRGRDAACRSIPVDTLCRSRVVSSTVSFTRFPHGNPFQSSSPFARLRFP